MVDEGVNGGTRDVGDGVGGLRPNAIVVGSGELSGHAVWVVSLQSQE